MIRSLYSASTAMFAQQLNMDTISNNLSNVNTGGFKKSRVVFQDLLYSKLPSADVGKTPATLQVGNGVRVVASLKDFSAGNLTQTDQPLDVALGGDGFLVVNMGTEVKGSPDGRAYTRAGSLQISDGRLVNMAGYPLLDINGREISIPNGALDVQINEVGVVSGFIGSNQAPTDFGQLAIARPVNQQVMEAIGGNLYVTNEAVALGAPGSNGRSGLLSGFQEMSNVQVVEEMVNLITAQRAYEVGSKAIQASDEMLGQANNLRR